MTSRAKFSSVKTMYANAKDTFTLANSMWAAALAFVGMVGTPALADNVVRSQAVAIGKDVAAVVDGQPITTSDVQRQAMAMAGPSALEQLIEFRLIDDEARKRGITVTSADLARALQKERASLIASASAPGRPGGGPGGAPSTLEEELKLHHMTMAQFKGIITRNIEVRKLLIGQVAVFPLYHIRAIMIFVPTFGGSVSGPMHTDAEAKALVEQAEADLKSGKTWDAVVRQYSEDEGSKAKSGDLGIINKATGYDQGLTNAAANLRSGQFSAPLKILDGYAIVERVSAGDSHSASEDKAYADAENVYEDSMISRIATQYVASLVAKAKVVNYLAP